MTRHDRCRIDHHPLQVPAQADQDAKTSASVRALKRHVASMRAFPDTVEGDAAVTLLELATVLKRETALIERLLQLLGALPLNDVRRIAAQARQALGQTLDTICAPGETANSMVLRVQNTPEYFGERLHSATEAFVNAMHELELALIRVESRL